METHTWNEKTVLQYSLFMHEQPELIWGDLPAVSFLIHSLSGRVDAAFEAAAGVVSSPLGLLLISSATSRV